MERRNLFLFIYIFQWKEDFYLHFSIERENISYLLMLPCRLENISFSLFSDGLRRFLTKKIFSFHSQINDRVAFQLLSYLELAYLCFYLYRFYQNKLYFKRHQYTMIYQCLFCYIGLYRLTTEP